MNKVKVYLSTITLLTLLGAIVVPANAFADTLWSVGTANNIYNTNSGNVGIGSQTPVALFNVTDAGAGTGNAVFGDLNNSHWFGGLFVQGTNDGSQGAIVQFARNNATLNPQSVSNFIKMQEYANGSLGYIGLGNEDFQVVTGLPSAGSSYSLGSPRFTVKNNGKVGIGTTNPSQTLDVVGNIKLSGSMVSDGDICIGTCP